MAEPRCPPPPSLERSPPAVAPPSAPWLHPCCIHADGRGGRGRRACCRRQHHACIPSSQRPPPPPPPPRGPCTLPSAPLPPSPPLPCPLHPSQRTPPHPPPTTPCCAPPTPHPFLPCRRYLEQVLDTGVGVPRHPLFFLGWSRRGEKKGAAPRRRWWPWGRREAASSVEEAVTVGAGVQGAGDGKERGDCLPWGHVSACLLSSYLPMALPAVARACCRARPASHRARAPVHASLPPSQIPVEAEDVRAERLRVEAMPPGEAAAAIAIRDLQKTFPASGGSRCGCGGSQGSGEAEGGGPAEMRAVCPAALAAWRPGPTALRRPLLVFHKEITAAALGKRWARP